MNAHLTTDEIHDWLDGALDAADEERCRRHADVCARCRAD